MNDKLDVIFDSKLPRLVPYELIEEFNDILDDSLKEKFRANSLRAYLEGIIDMFFKNEIISKEGLTVKSWNKKNLFQQIEMVCKHYDSSFNGIFNNLRNIGNKGSHFGGVVTHQEVVEGLEIVITLAEEIFISYFRKHPFGTEKPVMTYLSALPPINRAYILQKLWNDDKNNLDIIDKLSMAYLKSGNKKESLDFLNDLKSNNHLSDCYHSEFTEKIEILSNNIDKFDISQNLFDTWRIFTLINQAPGSINQYPEFKNIFFTLLKGYDSMCKGVCFKCGNYTLFIMYDGNSYPIKFFCSSCSYKRSDISPDDYLTCPECGAVSLLYDDELKGGICLWHRCANHKDGGILIEMEPCSICNSYKIENVCACNNYQN